MRRRWRRGARPVVLGATGAHSIGMQSALEQLAAQRRLEATANAAWRAAFHLQAALAKTREVTS